MLLLRLVSFPELKSKIYLTVAIFVILAGVFWLSYGMFTETWRDYILDGHEKPFRKLMVIFLKYPDLYIKFFHQWYSAVPISFLMILATLSGLAVYSFKKGEKGKGILFVVALYWLLTVAVTISHQPTDSTRYSLFYYPIVLLLSAYAIVLISKWLVGVKSEKYLYVSPVILILFLVLSEDYSYDHLINIDSERVNFRKIYDQDREYHLWRHIDFKTPAAVINKELGAKDTVISMMRPVHYYLDKLDFLYMKYDDVDFLGSIACDGKKDRWSNAIMLYNNARLLEALAKESEHVVWYIMRSNSFPYQSKLEHVLNLKLKDYLFYTNVDKSINVFRLDSSATALIQDIAL